MLAIVVCHYNPGGFARPVDNFRIFERALGHAEHVYTVEAVFPGREQVTRQHAIAAGPEHVMWQKERLLSLAVSRLPAHYDQVAFIDADLLFLNRDWYEQAARELQTYPVCQLCESVCDTDAHGHIVRSGKTLGWRMRHAPTDYKIWYRTGGAWAVRREVAETCLYDRDIIGGGDAAMAFAWTGEPGRYNRHRFYHAAWSEHYLAWAARQFGLVQGRVGVVPGDAVHLWHGDPEGRNYVRRVEILRQHRFDPFADIVLDDNGLWRWTREDPTLQHAVTKYFHRRKEDG